MPRHVDAWMDGVPLYSVGPVVIKEVHEDAPKLEIMTGERPGRYGQTLLNRKRQSLRVVIEVVILELRDLAARARVVEQLASWAKGSMLELSNHRGRRLRVACTGEPTLGNVRDYAAAVRMEFTAYQVPFWEDNIAAQATISGSSGSGTLLLYGTEETPVNVAVEATGGTLTSLTVTVADKITLSNLNVPLRSTISFERDVRDNLIIRSNGVGLLSCRTTDSADDLVAAPGRVPVSFTANTGCRVVFSARGRWA